MSINPLIKINHGNMAKICNLVRSDHRFMIREMIDELNLNFYVVEPILTEDLNTKLSSDRQEEHRFQVFQNLLN